MNTIKKTNDFQKIYKNNYKIYTKYTIIFYSKNNDNLSKFGFVTSKKTGNAVQRNRIRRLFRIIVQNNKKLFKKKYNYILIGKGILKEIKKIKKDELEKDIIKYIERIK